MSHVARHVTCSTVLLKKVVKQLLPQQEQTTQVNHIPREVTNFSEPPHRGTENTEIIQQSPQRRQLEQTKRKFSEVQAAASLDSKREDESEEGPISNRLMSASNDLMQITPIVNAPQTPGVLRVPFNGATKQSYVAHYGFLIV